MVHADLSTDLCSKCSGPLSFRPRVNVDLDLDDSSTCSPLGMREMIPLCNEDLDDYDAEITRLQSQITHVRAQRKRLADYKKRIHFLLSSFRRFPNEVLCLIFESTCTENLLQEYPWPYYAEEPSTRLPLPVITYLPALAISAVCTRWRSLALASPRLWSQIGLEISVHEPPDQYHTIPSTVNSGFMCTIQLYLDRSVDTPLAIGVETKEYGYKDHPALKLLLNHTHRWKTFAYTGIYELDQLLGFDHSFPILETVSLNPSEEGDPERGEVACFGNAPNLHSIATGGQISDLSLTWKHLPSIESHRVDVSDLSLVWNRLTYLEIRLPKVDERLPDGKDMDLLRRHPALAVLKVRSKRTTFGPGITLLEKVESFTLMESNKYNNTSSLLESFFSSFTLPSLKELIILPENNISDLTWPPNAFTGFISRSTCILTTLSLSDVEISDLNLMVALRLLPSLVKFDIDGLVDPEGGSPITTQFISSLHGSFTALLPKLRYLSMIIHDSSFDDATFIDMVSSRWLPSSQATAGIDCLRSVVLHFSQRGVNAEVYKPLYQLDEMGMCVVITGQY